MRSIRRSLLVYLLVLLAVALSAVGLLVDRFANAAIRSREASEAARIEQAFKVRQIEAKTKFDADLLAEAKTLAKEVHWKTAALLGQSLERRGPPRLPEPQPPAKAPDAEAKRYRIRTAVLALAAPPRVAPAVLTVAAIAPRTPGPKDGRGAYLDPRRNTPFPLWADYDGPRAVARVEEAVRKTFEDDDHLGVFQFTIIANFHNRSHRIITNVQSVKLAKLGADLPFDADWLEPAHDIEPELDDVSVPGGGRVPPRRHRRGGTRAADYVLADSAVARSADQAGGRWVPELPAIPRPGRRAAGLCPPRPAVLGTRRPTRRRPA